MPLPSTISITACEKGKGGFFGWGRSGDSSKTQEGASAVGDDDNRNETGANVADDAKKLLGLPDNNSNINNHNNSFFAGSPDWMGLDGVAKVLGEKVSVLTFGGGCVGVVFVGRKQERKEEDKDP